jgi:hypothetical protein
LQLIKKTLEKKDEITEEPVWEGEKGGLILLSAYFAKGGYVTRFWAIYLNGELLAVTVYRKGAIAIAQKLAG